jgi:hypothetical protein
MIIVSMRSSYRSRSGAAPAAGGRATAPPRRRRSGPPRRFLPRSPRPSSAATGQPVRAPSGEQGGDLDQDRKTVVEPDGCAVDPPRDLREVLEVAVFGGIVGERIETPCFSRTRLRSSPRAPADKALL